MKKAQIITISVCAVGAIALLLSTVVLYRGVSGFKTASGSLKTARSKLERFYREPVFPSAANVQLEKANAGQVDRWYDELAAQLRKGNVVSKERSPSAFKTVYLARTLERLFREAQAAGTELPDGFGFGFERYAGTPTLPRPDDVPRLMEQLVLINRFSRILFANRIKAVSAVERAVFEDLVQAAPAPEPVQTRRNVRRNTRQTAAPAPAAVKSAEPGVVPEGGLFGSYRFAIEFTAKETALLGVLNALSASPSFTVIKIVRLNKNVPELMPVVQQAAEARVALPVPGFGAAAPATPQPVVRLGPNYPVSGLELEIPMQVRMELDVYKFKGDSDESGD